jgi:NADH-quinone oxidoreductase subunit M
MEFTGFPFLTAILLTCVTGLLVILVIPENRKAQIKWVSAVCSGMTLILSVYLFFAYDKSQGGLQFVEKIRWVESIGITYLNAADGFNLPMLLLTGIVFFTGVLTMWGLDYRVKEFFALYFLLVAGVFGLFMSMDLFFIFVWYDVSLIPMYLLIAIWGSTRKEYGAMKLTLYLLAGSALILPAIIYLYVQAGLNTFDVTVLMRPGTFSPFEQKFAFIFLFIGFGILAAVWPFHTWSPVGHVAAPTSVSMVHAGVLMKIGAFGILRVGIFLCPEGWQYWAPLMAVLAVIGIVYGAFVGLSQTDLKYCSLQSRLVFDRFGHRLHLHHLTDLVDRLDQVAHLLGHVLAQGPQVAGRAPADRLLQVDQGLERPADAEPGDQAGHDDQQQLARRRPGQDLVRTGRQAVAAASRPAESQYRRCGNDRGAR